MRDFGTYHWSSFLAPGYTVCGVVALMCWSPGEILCSIRAAELAKGALGVVAISITAYVLGALNGPGFSGDLFS